MLPNSDVKETFSQLLKEMMVIKYFFVYRSHAVSWILWNNYFLGWNPSMTFDPWVIKRCAFTTKKVPNINTSRISILCVGIK